MSHRSVAAIAAGARSQVARRTFMAAAGALLLRPDLVLSTLKPSPTAKSGMEDRAGPNVAGWLAQAPLQCVYRADDNFDGSSGALSALLLGSLGGEGLMVRSIFTHAYGGMSFSGHYGDDPLEGGLSFGTNGNEDSFTASAHLGTTPISLRCPSGGTARSGWTVEGTVGPSAFDATFGGPRTLINGHEVTFLEGSLGEAQLAVSGEFYAELVPRSFSVSLRQGPVTARSAVTWTIGPSPFLGTLSGSLSGPAALLMAGLAWWAAVTNIINEGFGP
ncbi:MAG TPA: hypothetical protein VME20_00195 [Acidimicrobiales bacterium]|nr:hypothetical protein [Acidimicrobiales bacterium]